MYINRKEYPTSYQQKNKFLSKRLNFFETYKKPEQYIPSDFYYPELEEIHIVYNDEPIGTLEENKADFYCWFKEILDIHKNLLLNIEVELFSKGLFTGKVFTTKKF